MGCNSHLLIEYRPYDGSYWWTYAKDLAESRDYLMYSALADVRGFEDSFAVVPPRGFPPDGDELKKWCEDYGGHTPSWLTPDEYKAAFEKTVNDRDKARREATDGEDFSKEPLISKEWTILNNLLQDLKNNYGDEKVRLCFFFDN